MMAEKRRQSARQGGGGGDDDGFGGGDTTTSSAAFVPQSLQQQRNIDVILRTADEVQQDDPQVARILCEYAYSLSQHLDPKDEGRGVLQFKTGLLSIIKQKRSKKEGEKIDRSQDIRYVQDFYRRFRERNQVDELEEEVRRDREHQSSDQDTSMLDKQEKLRRVYLMARILNEVVEALQSTHSEMTIDLSLKAVMANDAKKLQEYKAYNILPLETPGVTNSFQLFPEVSGATRALEYTSDLPKFPDTYDMPKERALDVFDFLHYVFGFQNDNVANQREHLVLLLANAQSRLGVLVDSEQNKVDIGAINSVHNRLNENYDRWCNFLRRDSMAKRAFTPQMQLFLTALYLLIWGEAANLRFLPECLCYIFHHMADELYDLLDKPTVGKSRIIVPDSPHSFLDRVIKPIHEIVVEESTIGADGRSPHSAWRNYDDFNEFFWAPSCFEISWPWRSNAGFFKKPKKLIYSEADRFDPAKPEQEEAVDEERKVGKTHFVEHRTGLHLYHSFHRLWIFLVCMLQGLTIFAFCNQELHIRSLKYIMSVGPTFIVMKFLQSFLDVTLMVGAYRSTRARNVSRMLIRFFWFASLSAAILLLYIKTLQEEARSPRANKWFRAFYWVLGIYAGFQLFLALVLRVPLFRMQLDRCSNFYIVQFVKWVHQERYYVGRGMYESTLDYFMYTSFWWVIGVCKFAFSYFLQIKPLVEPTRIIVNTSNIHYRWPDKISASNHNALTLMSLWAPILMIYFLDAQIWYMFISAVVGGLDGAGQRLGEIRTLDMIRQRFSTFPEACVKCLQPSRHGLPMTRSISIGGQTSKAKVDAIKFAPLWNAIINSLREEDLISNREREWLRMPDNSITTGTEAQHSLVQWPLFLLANKVYVGVDIVKEYRQSTQEELWERISRDPYLVHAVQESFEDLQPILLALLNDDGGDWVRQVYEDVQNSITNGQFVIQFNLSALGLVLNNTTVLTEILAAEPQKKEDKERKEEEAKNLDAAEQALIGLYEVVMQDFMIDPDLRYKYANSLDLQAAKQGGRLFSELKWPTEQEKADVDRLNYILTIKDSALNVPRNLEARRRLQYFTTSLFMTMPAPPAVRKMFSFSVFTPYYDEDVMYSIDQLTTANVDGITTLFYLQKIYPDEWTNFLERQLPGVDRAQLATCTENHVKDPQQLRLWASYRGQTLARTVRGMMYYKYALELQGSQEGASTTDEEEGLPVDRPGGLVRSAKVQAELKFTYVVSCQSYGEHKNSPLYQDKVADIAYLMYKYDSLRIAYVDTVKEMKDGRIATMTYYSKLIKADPSGRNQEIYSIKLPGRVFLGEGKAENQNHAIIFTRGDALQKIDMNQDNYLEETLKMRNLLEEFDSKKHGLRSPSILGVREHVFTGSVSSLAWFMSMQEITFVTIGQRVLAHPLKVRMHYGHSDVFDRLFHISRGGISKASKQINLSGDIFTGFNTTLRQGNITHHEYIQCGKGRDVGLNQIAAFQAKVASGNGEQTLSRDIYRLGQLFDFFRMLSFFFNSVGFYWTTLMTVLTVYVFLYGKVYLALSGIEDALKNKDNILGNKALEAALDTGFLFQIGLFAAVPLVMNFILEQGVSRAVISFITMQLQLSSIFYMFSIGTRAHAFSRTILHGGAKYRSAGRGFVVEHIPFTENYRQYSRSHFVRAMEIIFLLIVYLVYGSQDQGAVTSVLLTYTSWFLAFSWLYAPFIFNPSGYEWQKTVQDFNEWSNWLVRKGGIGDEGKMSWEIWWNEEQAHIQTFAGRFWEVVLSLRFFIFQYGVIYTLNVARNDINARVYGYSWLVMIGIFILFKVFTISPKLSANFQLVIRLFQGLVFLALVAGVSVAVSLTSLSVRDVFASSLALIPTGWGVLSIGIAIRPILESRALRWAGLWNSIRTIARLYDAAMGTLLFIPIASLSWFPFISTFQTRLVFNQAFSRGLEISVLLAGTRPNTGL